MRALSNGINCLWLLSAQFVEGHALRAHNKLQSIDRVFLVQNVNEGLSSTLLSGVAALTGGVDQMCSVNKNVCRFKDDARHVTCQTGGLIPELFLNDGIGDCADASDERAPATRGQPWYMSHYFTIKSEERDLSLFQNLGRRSYVDRFPAISYVRGNERVHSFVYLLLNIASGGQEWRSSVGGTDHAITKLPTPTHKGLGLRFDDKDSDEELSRIDLQVYTASWTSASLPIANFSSATITKIGDVFDWSANAIFSTFSKSRFMWSQDWRQEVYISTIDYVRTQNVLDIVFQRALHSVKYWLYDVQREDMSLTASSYACEKVFDAVVRNITNMSLYGKDLGNAAKITSVHWSFRNLRMVDLRDPDSHKSISKFMDDTQKTLNTVKSLDNVVDRYAHSITAVMQPIGKALGSDLGEAKTLGASITAAGSMMALRNCNAIGGTWAGPTFYHADGSPYDVSDATLKYFHGRCDAKRLPYVEIPSGQIFPFGAYR